MSSYEKFSSEDGGRILSVDMKNLVIFCDSKYNRERLNELWDFNIPIMINVDMANLAGIATGFWREMLRTVNPPKRVDIFQNPKDIRNMEDFQCQ